MNKLLLEWCDKVNSWNMGPGSKDHEHFKRLYEDWEKSPESSANISSYLVLHKCYCIHDYRRMGLRFYGYDFDIPGIETLLRTCIIPLVPVFAFCKKENVSLDDLSIKYSMNSNVRMDSEKPVKYLSRIGAKENHSCTLSWKGQEEEIPVLLLAEFCSEAIHFVLAE